MSAAPPRIVVIGDVVLDREIDGSADRLSPDSPVPVVDADAVVSSPGGAGLAALLCHHDPLGAEVVLIAPIAADDAGEQLLGRLGDIDVTGLGHVGPTRTKTRVRARGQNLLRVDEGGPGTPTGVDRDHLAQALARADAVLVSDYGAGVTRDPVVRDVLTRYAQDRPLVWDPHPLGGDPVAGAALVTPNETEARAVLSDRVSPADTLAGDLREVWAVRAVAVTSGPRGAFLAQEGTALFAPVEAVDDRHDTCGAGDSFAASATVSFAHGHGTARATVRAAQDARDWVERGAVSSFRHMLGDDSPPAEPGSSDRAMRVAERIRRANGTLVATGGCFDVLHTGHLATLEAARRLGDGLVVLLNSDASVRRRKGPGRPAVPAAERARMLQALRCVDAVEIFDDDAPSAALEAVRPDIWVKGGDYVEAAIPEAAVVRRHGGRVILLPRIPGRSTTALLQGVDDHV